MRCSFLPKSLILSLFAAINIGTLSPLKSMDSLEDPTTTPSIKTTQVLSSIPQINIDEFDKVTMTNILKNYGSFEVVGPSVDKLSEQAIEALKESKQVLNLPLESLERVYHQLFNGFQNVHKETSEAFERDGKRPIRNQIAYHFKPYLEPRIPEGIKDLKAIANYYTQAASFLYRLYDKIADTFIKPDQKTVFKEDAQTSCLTIRKYFPGKEGESGITPHTDFGLLTLVVSDRDGLEILEGRNVNEGRWLNAPYGNPGKPRFYINVGDWLFLQTGNEEFGAGIHRVPNVEEDRYSLILFMNPPGIAKFNQTLITLDGVKMDYLEFQKAYQRDFERNLNKCTQHFLRL